LLDQYLAELPDENEKLVILGLCKIISSKKSSKLCRATIKELEYQTKGKLNKKELYKIIERLEKKGFVKGIRPLRRRRSKKAIICLACQKLSGFTTFLEIIVKQLPYYKPSLESMLSDELLDESKVLRTLSQLKNLEKNIRLFSSLMKNPDFLRIYRKHFSSAVTRMVKNFPRNKKKI